MRSAFVLCVFALGLGAQTLDLLWKLPLNKGAAGPPAVFDGGTAVALADGRIVFVDMAGRETATARMDQAAVGPPLIASGRVFGADAWGAIYCFGMNGERIWKYERQTRAGSGYNTLVPWGGGVVLTDTRGRLYAVDGNGRLRLEIAVTSYRLSTPAVADVDGDGVDDFVFGGDDETVYCVSGKGYLLWQKKLPGGRFGRSLPAVADLDGDGRAEVYMTTPFVGRQTGLHALDAASGDVRWHVKSEMQTYASLVFLDVDGDGKRDILFGDKNTRLYAVDARGRKLWDTQMGGRGIFYAGTAAGEWIYQIARDGGLDGKSLYVLNRNGQVKLGVPLAGGGGYGPALARAGGESRLLAVSSQGTLHAFRIADGPFHWSSWRNGAASKSGPGAFVVGTERERRMARRGTNVLPGPTPRSMRVARPDGASVVTIGSASFGVAEAGEYRVYLDRDANPIVYAAGPEPLALRAPASELGDAVAARLRAEHELAMKHPSVKRFDALRERVREAEELFALARPGADVLLRQLANPWGSERKYRDGFGVKMLGNEFEAVAFGVTNLRPVRAQVRVVSEAKFVDLREVTVVRPESTGRLTEDGLPRLNGASVVTLEPGETRKLWAIVNSRELAAGVHAAVIRAGDMHSLAKPVEVALRVEVSRARLPEKRTYQQCNWLYVASIVDAAQREATIVDALEHGMTVFPIPALTFPLAGTPDSALHDAIIARLKGKATFLVSGSVGGPLAEKDYAAAVRKYSEHMLALGLRFDEWAFYYMDEPGLMGKDAAFEKYVRDITRLKEADPRVRIYANPAGGAKPEMLAPLTKLVDIWQPDLHLVREQPEAYARVFSQGVYWHYEAPADQRNLDSLGYYRMKPWVAFQMGMTGGGYWVYSYSPFWFFDAAMGTEYGTVYQTPQGPVTTKRWEASRDGAEDFELLWQVRSVGDAAALKLVDEAVAFVTAGQEGVSDISRQVAPIAPDYDRWMRYRAELIAAWERML